MKRSCQFLPNMKSELDTICNLCSEQIMFLPHHPGNCLSSEFIYGIIKKYYRSAVLSNQTILRRCLCQVDLEGKLKYLRNTGDFHGHNTLNNWSFWEQGGPALVVANIDIWKLYESWWHLCIMTVFYILYFVYCSCFHAVFHV